jgi:hypothetical protein
MDLFDLFPIVPPQFPGERSSRDPLEQVAAAVAVGLLPLAGALLVLFSGLKGHAVVALVVMPLVFATVAYLLGRRLSVSVGRSLLLGVRLHNRLLRRERGRDAARRRGRVLFDLLSEAPLAR